MTVATSRTAITIAPPPSSDNASQIDSTLSNVRRLHATATVDSSENFLFLPENHYRFTMRRRSNDLYCSLVTAQSPIRSLYCQLRLKTNTVITSLSSRVP